ncbi:MAG: hypothetical protein R3B54_10095 [Bdellovibrionota bacterium]
MAFLHPGPSKVFGGRSWKNSYMVYHFTNEDFALLGEAAYGKTSGRNDLSPGFSSEKNQTQESRRSVRVYLFFVEVIGLFDFAQKGRGRIGKLMA